MLMLVHYEQHNDEISQLVEVGQNMLSLEYAALVHRLVTLVHRHS